MTTQEDWMELDRLDNLWRELRYREEEIVQEWMSIDDEARKRELEEEARAMPFLDTLKKLYEQRAKCHYFP